MKKQILTSLLFALSFMHFATLSVFAQERGKSDTDMPPSMRYALKKEVPEIFFDYPDDQQRAVDSLRKTRYPATGGHSIKREINFMKHAVCEKLPNGDKVYRLKFSCDAVLDMIYFKDIEIPQGATMYAHYPQKNMVRPIKIQENAVGEKELWGYDASSLIIEYLQPKKVKQKPKIVVRNLSLRYSENTFEKSIADEQDVVCYPLIRCPLTEYAPGFPMTDYTKDLLANSVVKLHIYRPPGCSTTLSDWDCSGAFINSTDKRLFVLTANHNLNNCYAAGSTSNPVKLRIRFNHELLGCDESSDLIGTNHPFDDGTGINSAMDAFLVARNPNSDMALLEIPNVPSSIANLHMASFDNWFDLPSEGIGIHHPQGLAKRFSVQADYLNPEVDDGVLACNYNSQMTIATVISHGDANPNGSYFAVNYDVGFPAGGSSGSPFFDTYGSIIGQLNGGNAYCVESGDPAENYISLYGRLWASWDQGYDFNGNGTIEYEEAFLSTLQPHLDPYLITDGFMPMRLHNHDLVMYDDPFDVSAEPNFETDNFFNSPNIINCIGQAGTNDCIEDVPSLEEEDNTIKITVYNNGSYYPTSGAVVEVYLGVVNSGLNKFYICIFITF